MILKILMIPNNGDFYISQDLSKNQNGIFSRIEFHFDSVDLERRKNDNLLCTQKTRRT